MEWKKAIQRATDYNEVTFSIPNRWLHLHYYEALNILFRVENALRVFVYIVLKNTFYDKWGDIQIDVAEGQPTSIAAAAKKRVRQAQDFGYLGYEISSPLMHLNSGELIRLITSDEYWKYFAKYFKGRKEIIRNKLEEIGSIRNSLAHFRPIREDDVELIKQNAKHALLAVEGCLAEITSLLTLVPTNTTENWYLSLGTLGTQSCQISLHQSESLDWVRVQLIYKSHILNASRYSDEWLTYQVLNFKTPAIIQLFPAIARYVTFASEDLQYVSMPEDLRPQFNKTVSAVFSREVLQQNLSEILDDLKSLLSKVSNEEELVGSDNLARGEMIEPASVTARLVKEENRTRWDFFNYALRCPFKEDHPAEYWGDLGFYQRDFIAGTTKYPWMPSEISGFDI